MADDVRVQPLRDTLGDFTATYAFQRNVRGVDTKLASGVEQPTNLLTVGEYTVTRKGEWICIRVDEDTPLPAVGTAPAVSTVSRVFFLRDNCLHAMIAHGVYYENPGQEAILEMGPVPFVTDLPYVWDGQCLLSNQQAASRNSGLGVAEQVEVADGVVRRTFTDAQVLEFPAKTMRMKRVTEREAGTLRLRSQTAGLHTEFADGSSFLMPVRELEVTRYVDNLAAGLKLTAYNTVPRDGQAVSLESVQECELAYGDKATRDDLFLMLQEKLELLSIRPATESDKASPLDYVEGVVAVAADNRSLPRPVVEIPNDEGGEARRLLSLDAQSLTWTPIP